MRNNYTLGTQLRLKEAQQHCQKILEKEKNNI